jgi:hypothetical protein
VSPTDENYEGVAFGNGRWVIVGDDGSILSSPDGVEWSQEINPAAPGRLDDVAYGGGVFVAVGRSFNMLLTSVDGHEWTKQTPGFSGAVELIHDGSKFVTVLAGGYVATSTNGVDWSQTEAVPVNYDIGGVAFGNGIYVEAGYKRTGQPPDLFSSSGLSDWQARDAKLSENLMNAGFGLGLFVVVGQRGALATSPDGVEWTPRDVDHSGFIWDVAAGGGHMVAAAQWGRLLVSANGTDWVVRQTGLDGHLTDIAFGNGTFVAAGWDGQIVQSDAVDGTTVPGELRLTGSQRTGNQFSFQFSGQVGQTYEVQTSENLVDWAFLSTVECTEPQTWYSDTTELGRRFYRLVRPE